MQGVKPFLTFRDGAEEAMNLYVALIPNSRITSLMKGGEGGPIGEGQVLHATFELDGHEYGAMDGGDSFAFAQGFSIFVTCDSQEEVDRIWAGLTSDGGVPGPCGWLTDPYGVSWQVVPSALGEMMGAPAQGNSQAVMKAMLGMSKIDIAQLREAYATPVETAS